MDVRPIAVLTLALAVAGPGCEPGLVLSAARLEIAPNPAQAGDLVVASFVLTLVPTESHTIILYVDDEEEARLTSSDPRAGPVSLDLGDAADLIANYGTGAHSASVEVRLNERGDIVRTQSYDFELQDVIP